MTKIPITEALRKICTLEIGIYLGFGAWDLVLTPEE